MRSLVSFVLTLGLSATGGLAEVTAEQVAGKTLTLNKSKFVVGTDGTFTGQTDKGENVVGTWAVVDGKWCRTISEPARLAGKACQTASVEGRNFILVREDGTKLTYKMK